MSVKVKSGTTGRTVSALGALMVIAQVEDDDEVREAAGEEVFRVLGGEAGVNHFKLAARIAERGQMGAWN